MTDLEACKQLLLRLHRRESVAALELKRALGDQHWNNYQLLRAWAKTLREEAKIASYLLRDYVQMLRIADLHDAQPNRIISLRRRRRRKRVSPIVRRPATYERALEYLSERIEENVSLAQYLDRSFTPYGCDSTTDIGPDKDSVPRLWYTKNALPQIEERKIKTIWQLRKEALEKAIEALSAPPAATRRRHLKRLRLRRLRKSG